jgi:hypothetical protein
MSTPTVSPIVCPKCKLQGRVPATITAPFLNCPQCGTPVANPVAANGPQRAGPDRPGRMLDDFFARAYDVTDDLANSLAPAGVSPPETHAPSAPPAPPPPAPAADSSLPRDPAAERAWLEEERQRLEAYMRKHFAMLQQQREEFAAWRTNVEGALVSREQELSREKKQILAHIEACNQRGDQLEAQAADLEKKQAAAEEAARAAHSQEQARLEALQRDTAQVEQALVAARQTHTRLQETIAAEKAAHALQLADMRKRLAELTAREQAHVKADKELQFKTEQVRALEQQIFHEVEKQEQQMALERRQLEQSRTELAKLAQEHDTSRGHLLAMTRELDQLRTLVRNRLQRLRPGAPVVPE